LSKHRWQLILFCQDSCVFLFLLNAGKFLEIKIPRSAQHTLNWLQITMHKCELLTAVRDKHEAQSAARGPHCHHTISIELVIKIRDCCLRPCFGFCPCCSRRAHTIPTSQC